MTQSNGNGYKPSSNGRNGKFRPNRVLNSETQRLPQTHDTGSSVETRSHPDAIETFDQPVVLRQSPSWSRAIVWTIVGVVTFGVGWAYFAKIEQVIPATGQLRPQGTVKEVQAPLEGVVQAVYVEDGQPVEAGDLLIRFDANADTAKLDSVKQQRNALLKENQIYRSLLQPSGSASLPAAIVGLNLPPGILALRSNRDALVAENRQYRAQLAEGSARDAARLRAARAEAEARRRAADLEVAQIRQQLLQTQGQINSARARLATQQEILGDLQNLYQNGGIGRLQYVEQQQKVQDQQAEITQLVQEAKRLELDIAQGREETVVTVTSNENEIRDRIAANEQRIAEIDSQLSQGVLQVIVNNEKQIADLNSQLSSAEQTLEYRELRATESGTVFDLQVHQGFVANPTTSLLSIVPNQNLVAEVFITNKDIGFVREGMKTDVRVDSFPFSEFGDIKGEIVSVGSDALPPDEVHPYYRFPAKVRLDNQVLAVREREIPLQSGMAVSVNIKVREDRRVINLFTELFTDRIESLKEVR
ncbi:MAG: HlyD family efflux transporter periplasmic adaptor subunit [Cyanobacteriota bacterium]|nr:HlyD family efflux transporter periplasmic adaptor subunit [Cyanobacteriota bacterium]